MNRIGKALLNYLIKGLLIVLPIALSIYIVIWAVTTVDSWLNVNNILGVDPRTGESRNIPGLGLALVVALILTAGIFVTNFVTEPMYNWFNRWMNRLPGLNFIYSSIKDLTEAFVGDEKKFNHPVLVEITADIKRIGFLTQNDLSSISLPGDCVVYFPFSYSFAGQVCVVSKDKIKELNMNAADAMKLVVSGGVSHI
ncbi:putative membrane protein [Pedobacter cryoconitis]|uniref:Putative membrane protein n=1 Tax=Pedobacter cryoconitis TaxID=188932 RepID=A0A7W8ZNU2_9SPHI|nr:DUF502 domain-containing protein [Pedobacter cryoconitis]MBB5637473.1 putative membrane protein [Pedobacter cryoconitis]MBB6269900.1 putative membrane protein [Pedobacter cryoconitis]